MNIIILPETIRQKLGDDAAKEFVDLFNAWAKAYRGNNVNKFTERLNKRLAETESKIIQWMLGFFVAQVTVTISLISLIIQTS